jgi:hypothetical protein
MVGRGGAGDKGSKAGGAITWTVIGEKAADRDAEAGVVVDSLEKRGGRRGFRVGPVFLSTQLSRIDQS